MSKLKFCSNCGHKFAYKFAIPNFCPSCGTATSGKAKAVDKDSREPSSESIDDGNEHVPHIDKIKAKVEYDSNITTLSFDEKKGFFYGQKKFDKRTQSFDE